MKDYLGQFSERISECSIPEQLMGVGIPGIFEALEQIYAAPEIVQRMVLTDILKNASDSEWGQKYRFSEVHSAEEYAKKMPVTEYAQYKEAISKLEDGAEDILYNGKTEMFLATSGSTGIPKYIPESRIGNLVKTMTVSLRSAYIQQMIPNLLYPGAKLLAIYNPAEYEKTKGGISVGSASGQASSSGSDQEADIFVLPPEFLSLSDLSSEDRDYIVLLFAISQEEITGIVCNNPGHFQILIDRLNKDALALAEDLEMGRISVDMDAATKETLEKRLGVCKERAQVLRKLKEEKQVIAAEDLWNHLVALGCWTSGSVGRSLKEVREILPEQIKVVDWGYGASEGKFNIPRQLETAEGLAVSFGYFFEFLPLDGGEPVFLWQVEDGKEYELLVTSYSGLYRYNIHDIVRICGTYRNTPQIIFECKKSDGYQKDDMQLYSSQLMRMVEDFEKEYNTYLRHFEMFSDGDSLVLAVEPGDAAFDADTFATYIKEQLLANYQIELKEVWVMKEGYRDSLYSRSVTAGKTVNQTKLAFFTDRPASLEFRERII